MKPCHENIINGATIYDGRSVTVQNPLVLMFTLQLNILTGTFQNVGQLHF